MRILTVCLLFFCVGCGSPSPSEEIVLMTASDALAMPSPDADHRIPYGPEPLQFGELRLPEGEGPFPVAVVIHGGCWLAEYDLEYMAGLAASLTEAGVATWSIEYRRIGDEGGGWPGTFEDVAAAVDHLQSVAEEFKLDLTRMVAVGHSAGGHLALWLAGRPHLDAGDPLRSEAPQALSGVVALAGIPDLASFSSPTGCGSAVEGLLGGLPSVVPDRVERGSPIEMVPFGIPQILVLGRLDPIVPREQAISFQEAGRRGGDRVEIREIEGSGHFELVNPSHPAFDGVRAAVLELLEH